MKHHFIRPAVQALVILFAVVSLAVTSSATTAVMLSDEELITSSRVIVMGEVKSSKSQWGPGGQDIYTYVKVQVSQVLKGQLQSEVIVFRQLGGTVGDISTVIHGAPEYKPGQRVLLFLDTANDGTLRVAHLFQGKYDVVAGAGDGRLRVERKIETAEINLLGASEGPNITNRFALSKFTKKIKRTLKAKAAQAAEFEARFADAPIVEVPPEYVDGGESDTAAGDRSAQYTFLGQYRWFEPDTGQPVVYRINQSGSPIAGGGVNEINQALAAWTNVQTTSLMLQNGGATTANGFQRDGISAISYNDPLDQMSDPVGCSGTLAIGGVTSAGGSSRVIGGQTFYHIYEGDVVFNRNFSCFLGISANLAEVAAHEIGHSIGFGHSSDYGALMYATAHGGGRGATLGADDIAAVSFLYPGSKTTTPPPTAPSYRGYLDIADCSVIAGWAWNSNAPNTPINVDIYDGTTLIASVAANQFRQDLLNAQIGNGYHAFSFSLPASLKDGRAHTIRVKFSSSSQELSNSPRTITCGTATPSYQGYLDIANCNVIAGWAWNRNAPNTPINVDIYDGSVRIATVTASQYRQDLLAAGIGNGYHGFSFNVPSSLRDGKAHTIRVKYAGTSTELSNGPKSLTCSGQ